MHLGILLITKDNRDIEFIEKKIAISRRCIFSFMSLGNMGVPINPSSATTVYVSMSLCRMLYDAEVSDYSSKAIKCMEDTLWEVSGKEYIGTK